MNAPLIKIHNELIATFAATRKLRTTYQTNRVLKPIASYYLLKSITGTGIIKDYTKQLPAILKYLSVCKATFYSHLKQLESMKLVTRSHGSLKLASFAHLLEIFDITEQSNVTKITYTGDVKFSYLLEGSVIFTKQKQIKQTVARKIERIPELLETIDNEHNDIQAALLARQIKDFVNGTQSYEHEAINADVQITARNIFKRFNFKSYKSVAYLKKKLAKQNIAAIEKRSYVSPERSRKRFAYVTYLSECKSTRWHLPDNITFSNGLYK